jgi:hypothetical protein
MKYLTLLAIMGFATQDNSVKALDQYEAETAGALAEIEQSSRI